MNLLFFFLSIIFSTFTPTTTSDEGLSGNGTTTYDPSGGKSGKFGNEDFVIVLDGNP
ncbi:MAG: hypothetical protein JNJ57_05580 [Saprospiraceae bacterium]|nr:hypothetical protein [Saprospiraceae bacterium]